MYAGNANLRMQSVFKYDRKKNVNVFDYTHAETDECLCCVFSP